MKKVSQKKPITQQTVKGLRSDFRRLTKLYRDIPSHKDVYEGVDEEDAFQRFKDARKAFTTFRKRLNNWVFKATPLVKEMGDGFPFASEIVEAWSDFKHEGLNLKELFPTTYEDKPNLGEVARNRDSNIQSYQRYWRIFYKHLEDYLDYKERRGDEATSRAPEEVFNVGPVKVVVDNLGRDAREDGRSYDDKIDAYLKTISTIMNRIKGAGLGDAYKGLTITLSFDKRSGMRAGEYDREADVLRIFPMGMDPDPLDDNTLTHEIGHRHYYKVLSGGARELWINQITEATTVITKERLERFYELIWQTNGYVNTSKEQMKKLKGMERQLSPEDKGAFRYLVENGYIYDATRLSKKETLRQWRTDHGGLEVPLEFITEYGRTNPEEAYAEAFRLYVEKGPRALGEWTRYVFQKVNGRTARASLVKRVASRVFDMLSKGRDQ